MIFLDVFPFLMCSTTSKVFAFRAARARLAEVPDAAASQVDKPGTRGTRGTRSVVFAAQGSPKAPGHW